MDVSVHPSAVIDEDVELGDGTRVWHFVHISRGARLGERCVLGQNVFIGRDVRIGRGVKIQNNVSVYEGVEIEDDVFLGPSCVFTNVINPRASIERKDEFRRTRVRRGATVGANATILCGHELGEHCMIGAGSVVTRGAGPFELLVGNPARRLGFICACGLRLPAEAREPRCAGCRRRYRIDAERCEPLP